MKNTHIITHEDENWIYGKTFDEKNQFLTEWILAKIEDAWWHDDFEKILMKRMGLNLTKENLKQLRELYEGDLSGLYKIAALCRDEPNQNLAVQTHMMDRNMSIFHVHDFLAECRKHNITGARFKQLLKEYTTHYDLTKLDFSTTEAIQFDSLIENVLTENLEKISKSDKTKIVNYLVGQVIKQIENKKNVNTEEIRQKINDKILAGYGYRGNDEVALEKN